MQISPAIFIDFLDYFTRAQIGVFNQRRGRGFGECASGTDGGYRRIGLDHVARSADDVHVVLSATSNNASR